MPRFLLKSLFFIVLFGNAQLYAQHDWTRTNPGGGGAISMVGATADGTLVAGSDLSGVYIKKPNSATWKPLGAAQGLTETSITTFGFHPEDGDTFVIGTTIGAFKTKDAGETIYPVQIEFTPGLGLGYVESIDMSMSNPLVGYMAHYEWWLPALSFLKTEDAGDTWNKVTTLGIPEEARITKLLVDQNNSEIVYALTGKARFGCSLPNLYKSSNGGQDWVEIGAEFQAILDVDVHPTDSNIVYVSTFEANDCSSALWQYAGGDWDSGEFYKSVDGGSSFDQIGEQTGIISVGKNANEISLVNILTLDPDNPDSGTWRTVDGGTSWNHAGHVQDWDIGRANPSPSFSFSLSFNGIAKTLTKNRFEPENLNGSFGQWVWSSTDSGITIDNINSIEVSPGHFISTGVENIVGNAIDVNDANPNTIYVGYFDIGFFYSKDHGESWKLSIPDNTIYPDYSWYNGGGSNCNTLISDPELENVVWASFSNDQPYTKSAIFKSTDFGENWTLSNEGLDPFGETTHGLSIDKKSPVDARILYVTQKGNVFKSTDGGVNWVQKSYVGGLKFTAIDNTNSQLVYAGGENGLWRSTDGGETWSEKGLPEMHGSVDPEFEGGILNEEIVPTHSDDHDGDEATPELAPWRGVFEVKSDPKFENRVYVVGHGKDKGLYRSDDAGETWKKLYTNDRMRGVAIAPDNSEFVYASASESYHSGGHSQTDGIFITKNASAETPSWADATDGMAWPNGGRLEIEKGATPNIWAWGAGTGVQYALVPGFTVDEEPVDSDGDGFFNDVDCDDNDPAVNPEAEEVCDGIDNNCDGLIDDEDPEVTCDSTEGSAPLLEATFLMGSSNPSPTGPILRTEEGNRVTYMKFDLSSFDGSISKAELKMEVASDPGSGTLNVFLGNNSDWTESGLNGSNAPSAVGSSLATISGTHSLGQTKVWNLDVSRLSAGGELTLILQHSNGNDVAFASDETAQAPQLVITTGDVAPVDGDGDGFFNDVDCDDNDPAVNPEAEEVCDGIDNNCDGLIDDEDPEVTCDSTEYAADLLEATYLKGSINPMPTGPILRAEQNNRVIYMKFDLGSFNGGITKAELKMQVASDPGHGTLEIFLGSDSNWTENGLNGGNAPATVGSALATISGTHSLGQTKVWNLDVARLNGGGPITLILKHNNGNDVAFASDETAQAPQLLITAGSITPVDNDGDGFFNNVDCNDNDPSINPEAVEICDGIDNNCDGLIDGQDPLVTCTTTETSADLVDATYLQGSSNPSPTGPILRAEEGNRVTYLKFDLGELNMSVNKAELKMKVASDPGHGSLEVYLGTHSNWTENGLNGSNKPVQANGLLAAITGTHSLGQTKVWNLEVGQFPSSGLVTLIVKHSSGNDVAFASDETDEAPQLIIGIEGDGAMTNTLNLLPNPASDEITIGFEESTEASAIFVYDLNGKLVHSVPASEVRSKGYYQMNIESLPNGVYFVRTFDTSGVPHQKKMVIKH